MTGATFGGPVHTGEPDGGGPVRTGEPDDGPDADADHPELAFDGEPLMLRQMEAGLSTISGSSLHSEVPHLRHDWMLYPAVRSGAMRQHCEPPPNSQPYRNLGLSPVVLEPMYLPPQDPHLGVIALRVNANPWDASLTPRTRMWMDELGDHMGEYGFYFVCTPTSMRLAMVRAVCDGGHKGRFKGKIRVSLDHRQCRLHSLVSRCMLATSAAYFGPFTAALVEDLLPSLLQIRTTSSLQSQRMNLIVMIMVLCRLFLTSKPAFLLVKPAPKLLQFILGTRRIFQEPMGPLLWLP